MTAHPRDVCRAKCGGPERNACFSPSTTSENTKVLNDLSVRLKIAKGIVGYFRFPDQKNAWGGAFNGQHHRLRIFLELQEVFGFRTIVETGTYRGTTTEFFTSIRGSRVYSIESHPWSYGFCRARFFGKPNITLLMGDSRKWICELAKQGALVAPFFFYLDAHWEEDVPLKAELDAIYSLREDAVVMIDDFEVEGDLQYGYDDYGHMRRLDINYIRDILNKFSLTTYFPAARGETETGARRGSIVLVGRQFQDQMNAIPSLRRHSHYYACDSA